MTTAETEQRLQYEQETGERVRVRKPKKSRRTKEQENSHDDND
jgi:hypothetical protein